MAIIAVNKIAQHHFSATSWSTSGTFSPVVNRLYLAGVADIVGGGSPPTPNIAGCGLTWQQIATISVGVFRVTFFRAMKPSGLTSGALTISFGTLTSDSSIIVDEIAGVDTSGTDGSGAVVQFVPGSGASAHKATVNIVVPSADHAAYMVAGVSTSVSFSSVSGSIIGSLPSQVPSMISSFLSGVTSQMSVKWDSDWAHAELALELRPPPPPPIYVSLGRPTESEAALRLSPTLAGSVPLGQVVEVERALPMTAFKTGLPAQVIKTTLGLAPFATSHCLEEV